MSSSIAAPPTTSTPTPKPIAPAAPKRRTSPRPRRWWAMLTVALTGAVIGVTIWYFTRPAPVTPPVTVEVTTGDIDVTVESTGGVQAARSGDIPFQQGGQVTEVLVSVGDTVKAGDLLARVDAHDAEMDVQRAEAELAGAQAKLDELIAGNRPEEIAAAQASLDSALANLSEAQEGSSSAEIAAAEASLRAAQAARDALYEGPSRADLIEASTTLANAEAALQQAQAAYDQVAQRPDIGAMQQSLDLQEATHAYEAAQAKYDALQSGPTTSEIAAADAQISEAQANLDQLRAPADAAAIAAAEAGVRQAQADLDLTRVGNRTEVIAAQEATVTTYKIALEEAKTALTHTEVRAPYDGIVSAVSAEDGNFVSDGDAAVTLIDVSKYTLDLSVNEIDISQVEVGQTVNLTFDALPTETFTGTITSISPVGDSESGLVNYTVEMAFDPGESDVKVGMTASAGIVVDQKKGVLQVPNGAISGSGPLRTIQVLYGDSQTPVTIAVETGATNGFMTEIVSCLETGDLCLRDGDTLALDMSTTSGGSGGGGPTMTRMPDGGVMFTMDGPDGGVGAAAPVIRQLPPP